MPINQLVNRLYVITQQGDNFRNVSVKSIESDCRWSNNLWTCTGGEGIFEIDSVESDFRDKYDVNEAAN